MNKKLYINVPEVNKVVSLFKEVYLVGGGVIDLIQGRPINDWDLEIYQHSFNGIIDLLTINDISHFKDENRGVIKIKINEVDFDLTIPRVENKIGKGHSGFEFIFPALTPKEASSRRDFTINSLMYSFNDNAVQDHWGGLNDLERGILRPIDKERFMEDPIRIYRAANLISRKVDYVHSSLYFLANTGQDLRSEIPYEAIFAELNKVMIGKNPSKAFRFLENVNWSWPIFSNLKGLNEKPYYHPEGNTFEHTMLVLDKAAEYRDLLPKDWQLPYMYGMLLHDVGKANVMVNGSAIGHEEAGIPLVKEFMTNLRAPKKLIDKVCLIVKYHMRVNLLYAGNAKKNAYRRLFVHVPPIVLAYVARADSLGRLNAGNDHPPSDFVLSTMMNDPVKYEPIFRGRDLIKMGFCPGPEFSILLDRAFEMQLSGFSYDQINDVMKELYKRTEK